MSFVVGQDNFIIAPFSSENSNQNFEINTVYTIFPFYPIWLAQFAHVMWAQNN